MVFFKQRHGFEFARGWVSGGMVCCGLQELCVRTKVTGK